MYTPPNNQIKEYAEFALDQYPDDPWLHIHNLEDNDAWRVRFFFTDSFRHVFQSGVMIQDGDGFWHRMDQSDNVQAIVRALVVQGRILAAEEVEERQIGELIARIGYAAFLSNECQLNSMHVINVTQTVDPSHITRKRKRQSQKFTLRISVARRF